MLGVGYRLAFTVYRDSLNVPSATLFYLASLYSGTVSDTPTNPLPQPRRFRCLGWALLGCWLGMLACINLSSD